MTDSSHSGAFDVFVVVPTILGDDHLLPVCRRLFAHHSEMRVLVVLSVNPVDDDRADRLLAQIDKIERPENVELLVHREEGPIGFGAANNRGLMAAIRRNGGMASEFVVFHNDDAFVVDGWLPGLQRAFKAQRVVVWGEPWNEDEGQVSRKRRDVSGYGEIGMVGPISNLVAGIQQVRPPKSMNPDDAGLWARSEFGDMAVTADFISGFCVALSAEAVSRLMLFRPDEDGPLVERNHPESDTPVWPDWEYSDEVAVGVFDEDNFPIAGYEDNDLCVRAELAGIRAVVASGVYVSHIGHKSFDQYFPDAERGMRNRANYYRKWAHVTHGDHRLIGVCRLRLDVPNDLNFLKMAVARIAQTCDGMAILLTANPLEMKHNEQWLIESRQLRPEDDQMLQDCSGEDREGVAEVVHGWLSSFITGNVKDARFDASGVVVECWDGDFNERDERNRALAMGREMGATWLLSFDGDECIEDRIWRPHLERWMSHPDPMVRAWDLSWLNHWNYQEQVRIDPPWGDNGLYVGGMHGFRLIRVTDFGARPRVIMAGTENGLHCGNVPDHDVTAKRVAAFRMRHYGYLRPVDRQRKYRRYLTQDPDPEFKLIGGSSYAHIIDDEGMRASPYVKKNGIGLYFLVYEKEKPGDIGRWLDNLYGVADRVVLVWTGEWAEADRVWLADLTEEQSAKLAQWDSMVEKGREEVEAGDATQEQLDAAIVAHPRPRFGKLASEDPRLWVEAGNDWPETGPGIEMAEIAHHFGVEWVIQPLDDNLSRARNAALEVLQPDYSNGVGWALFYDPDEWHEDPYTSAVALRRMAEVSSLHGWLFPVVNFHEDAPPSASESIRMSRLVPQMRMNSRVHEGFTGAVDAMRQNGLDVKFRLAPMRLMHRGLAKDEEGMTEKLQRYQRLLLLELEEDPMNSGAWVSLGLQLMNDGYDDQAIECWHRAVAIGDGGFLPFRELAYFHLRKALAFHAGAVERATDAHPWVRQGGALDFQKAMASYVPDFPRMGSAQRGVPTCAPIELPDFTPPEATKDIAMGRRTLLDASVAELAGDDEPDVIDAEPDPDVDLDEVS